MGMLGGPAAVDGTTADGYMREWLAEGDASRRYLAARFRASFGSTLEWTPSHFVIACDWVALEGGRNRFTRSTAWGRRSDLGARLTLHGVRCVDAMVRYYAALAHTHRPQRWTIELDPAHPGYLSPRFTQDFPLMSLLPHDLADAINDHTTAPLMRHITAFDDLPGHLSSADFLPDGTPSGDDDSVTLARRTVGEHALEFAVMTPQLGGWTYTLWVDEGHEHVYGEEAYAALEPRLLAVDGIDAVMGEDREIVHVRTSLDPERMIEALVTAATAPTGI